MGTTSPQAFWEFPQLLGWAPDYYCLVVPDLRYNYLQKQDKERDGPLFEMTCLSSSGPTLTLGRETYLVVQIEERDSRLWERSLRKNPLKV